MLKRLLHLTFDAMEIDDISKARIEEVISTSTGFQSLKYQRCISLQQEHEIIQMIEIISCMLQ